MYGSLTPGAGGASLTLEGPTTAGGTSFDISITNPAAKRISLHFDALSTNASGAAARLMLRIGTGGSPDAAGYVQVGCFQGSGSIGGYDGSAAGFVINSETNTNAIHGSIFLDLLDRSNNIWGAWGIFGFSSPTSFYGQVGGIKALAGALDIIRFTTAGGAATYDAGTVGWTVE